MKVCLVKCLRKNFIVRSAVINAVTNPTSNRPASWIVKSEDVLRRSYPVAAAIVGTAKRNEKSTIASRLIPIRLPRVMVAAERDTPGITASA